MEISVELTFSPLQDNFKESVIEFIKKLRASGLIVMENPLSTQVYGNYDKVMQVLNQEIKQAFNLIENGIMYLKIVKGDRHQYKPYF